MTRTTTCAIAVVSSLLLTGVAYLVFRATGAWLLDLNVYRKGGNAVIDGAVLYTSTPRPLFTYPPFAAWVFTPLSLFDLQTGGLLWTLVSLACLHIAVWQCLSFLGVPLRWTVLVSVAFALFWLDPVRTTVMLGQVNLLILPLLLHDALRKDGGRWHGVAVGLAAGVKLVPGILIVYFLLTRRIAAAVRAAAVFLGTVLIGFALSPSEASRYWSSVLFDSSRIASPQNIFSDSWHSLLVRWTHSTDVGAAAFVVSAVFGIAGGWLAVWCHRRGQTLLGFCTLMLTTILILPIGWIHYWTWVLPPLLIYLGHQAWVSRNVPLAAAAVLLAGHAYVSPENLGVPRDYPSQLVLGTTDLLLTSTYTAIGLVILLCVAATAVPARATRVPGILDP